MIRFWMGFLIWILFWTLMLSVVIGVYADDLKNHTDDSKSHESIYVPVCLDLKKTCQTTQNTFFLMVGPDNRHPQTSSKFFTGYLRNIKPELSFGIVIDGTTVSGLDGFGVGFGYHF